MGNGSANIARQNTTTIFNSITHYWEYGKATAKVTIILIHGFRGEHHGLELIAKRLGDYRIVVPDLPGFGLSEPLVNIEHNTFFYHKWLNEFILNLKCQGKVALLGHSFGTIIVSAGVAAGLPVDYIILVNPLAEPLLKQRDFGSQLVLIYYWLANHLPAPFDLSLLQSRLITQFMSTLMTRTSNKKLKQWIHHQHLTYFSPVKSKKTLIEIFNVIKNESVTQYAKKINQPTLLIVAEKDNVCSISKQETLQSLFINARLLAIPKYGHLLHYEAPYKVANATKKFLRDMD